MAFEQERKVYRFQQGYGEMLLGAMDKAQAFKLICDNGVHPAWVIGHLALVAHNMTKRLGGGEGTIADEARWKTLFGGGSKPVPDAAQYPSFDEIIATWRKGHDALDAAVANAKPDALTQQNPAERMRAVLPTVGDLVSFILTGHEGMHLGQLSTWRRLQGMPAMF